MSGKSEATKERGRADDAVAKPPARPGRKASARSAERDPTVEAARRFKAIGEPTRLRIVLFLRGCEESFIADGLRGARVSEISRQVTGADTLTSTFSHHIKELRRAGLLRVERDGKNRWCRLETEALIALVPFLSSPAAAPPEVVPAAPNESGGRTAAPVKRTRKPAKD